MIKILTRFTFREELVAFPSGTKNASKTHKNVLMKRYYAFWQNAFYALEMRIIWSPWKSFAKTFFKRIQNAHFMRKKL